MLKSMTATGIGLIAAASLMAMPASAKEKQPEGGVQIDAQNNVRPTLNTVRVIDDQLGQYRRANIFAKRKIDTLLDVEGTYVVDTPTGFKKIITQIRNKTDVALPLEVRVSWYDVNGVPTDTAASWTHLFAQPRSMVTFESISNRLPSAQYYVEVRGAQ
ncbi:MAG: hypothetical protein JWO33_1542 [Caulobacteraceae bacterium]|nr:hypothetical protein [Caulobacteraceae bacterium]